MSETNDPEPVDAEFEPADESGNATRAPKRGGFAGYVIVFLLALIVGGTGGAWLFWQYGPQQVVETDLSPIEARLAALEGAETPDPFDPSELSSRISTLENAPAAAINTDELASIVERVEALESGEGEAPSDPTIPIRVIALEATLRELEEQVTALAEAEPAEGGPSAALAGFEARLAALESRPSGESASVDLSPIVSCLDALESRPVTAAFDPAGLETRLTELESVEPVEPDFSVIEARIASLEAALAQGLNEQAARGGEGRELAARSLALVALVEAANTHQSFEAERAALARLWRDQPALSSLANHARSGVPTTEDLAQNYPRDEIENAIGTNRVFFGLIEVRPSEGSEASPLAIVALASEQLADGNLDAAAQLTEQLEAEALAAAQSWLVQAHARLSVDAALTSLRTALTEEAAAQGADPT